MEEHPHKCASSIVEKYERSLVVGYQRFACANNSNSNWIFIALNPPNRKGTLRRNKTKTVNQSQCPGTEKSSAPRRMPG